MSVLATLAEAPRSFTDDDDDFGSHTLRLACYAVPGGGGATPLIIIIVLREPGFTEKEHR